MYRYLAFALGILVLVAIFAPSLGALNDLAPASDAAAEQGAVGPPEQGTVGPPVPAGNALTLQRDSSGQFHVDGLINGQPVRFLVDTGADTVALGEDDAARLGLAPDPSAFRPVLHTASGTGYGAPVRIARLSVAGHDLTDVDAVVARGLTGSLLGQSALRQIGAVALNGDQMAIGP